MSLPKWARRSIKQITQPFITPFKIIKRVLVGNSIVPDTVRDIIKVFKRLPNRMMGVLKSLPGKLVNFWKNRIWQPMSREVSQRMNGIRRTLNGWKNSAVKWVKNLVPSIVNFWKNRVWQPVATFLSQRTKGMSKTLSNWKTSAVAWVKNLVPSILTFWKNKVWQPVADFLVQRANGMTQTLSNWKNKAVNWVKNLVPSILNFWKNSVWQPAADFLVARASGMGTTLSNFKNNAVSWVKSLPGAIAKPFKAIFQDMADWVIEKKEGILQTMGNLTSGVKKLWDNLSGFVGGVVDRLTGGGGDGGENYRATPNVMGRARGGVDSGTYQDPSGRTPVDFMAAGGTRQRPIGGVANGNRPRVVYGEAGPESYVTLGRYTPESAEALRVANQTWKDRGWDKRAIKRGDAAYGCGHDHSKEPMYMAPGGRYIGRTHEGGNGAGMYGPTYNKAWNAETFGRVLEVLKNFKVAANTYKNHPPQMNGAYREESADFWSYGGRGKAISVNLNNQVRSFIKKKLKKGLNYTLGQGNAGHSGGQRHVHATWLGKDPSVPNINYRPIKGGSAIKGGEGTGTSGSGGSGSSGPSIWERVGNALWERMVQKRIDDFKAANDGKNVMGTPAGIVIQKGADKVKASLAKRFDKGWLWFWWFKWSRKGLPRR